MRIIRSMGLMVVIIGVLAMRVPLSKAARIIPVPEPFLYAEIEGERFGVEHPVIDNCEETKIRAEVFWAVPTTQDDHNTTYNATPLSAHVSVSGAQHGDVLPPLAPTGRMITSRARGLPGLWAVADFTYKPKTNGEEVLTFTTQITRPGGATQRLNHALSFTVEDCSVGVSMIYDLRWDVGSGSMVIGTGIMDEVTVEPDEDGNLNGEGALVYNQIITGVPDCAISWTTITSDVTITGQADGDQIGLNFAFGDASVTGAAICPEASVTSTQSLNPGSAFASSLTFPAEGGVMTYPSPNPVGGTVYVIVTREEDEQAASDAGSQALAVLSAWFAVWPGTPR
jgi:hypothetical protein